MVNTIKLRKGLNINLKGAAQKKIDAVRAEGAFGIVPDDFYGYKPKMVVREGDRVKAGDALWVNKNIPEVKVVSPVSGTISLIKRGDRRKVLLVGIEADEEQEYKDFGKHSVEQMSADDVKALLLDSGMLAFVRQRPYDIMVNPADNPKAIHISAFSKMPLAADVEYVLKGREEEFQTGIDALAKLAPVRLGISPEESEGWLAKVKNAEVTIYDGPNPSGNVGVQINHVDPVNKGEVVWTLGAEDVAWIGHLLQTGRVELDRVVALGGSMVAAPQYYKVRIGTSLDALLSGKLKSTDHVRIINGNPLVGAKAEADGYLSAKVTEVSVIPEGDDTDEVLGWIRPRLKDFSTSRSYFSWLQRGREYDLDARVKGGERHIIMSGEYDKVLPMDILAGYLIKAILTGNIERMEELGIYEVAPEDFAVAEFVDSSKLELQRIVRDGLDMLRKEMA